MRWKWIKTLITLILIAIIEPKLVDYIINNYSSEQIKEWWIK